MKKNLSNQKLSNVVARLKAEQASLAPEELAQVDGAVMPFGYPQNAVARFGYPQGAVSAAIHGYPQSAISRPFDPAVADPAAAIKLPLK